MTTTPNVHSVGGAPSVTSALTMMGVGIRRGEPYLLFDFLTFTASHLEVALDDRLLAWVQLLPVTPLGLRLPHFDPVPHALRLWASSSAAKGTRSAQAGVDPTSGPRPTSGHVTADQPASAVEEHYRQVKARIEGSGYQVFENHEPHYYGLHGGFNVDQRWIKVSIEDDTNTRLATLLHEFAHVCLDHDDMAYSQEDSDRREIIVEAVAFLILTVLGVEYPQGVDYVARHKVQKPMVHYCLEQIDLAVSKVLSTIDPDACLVF